MVELTKENVWEYLAIDYIKGSVGINENDDRLSFPGGQFVLRENVFLWKYSLKKCKYRLYIRYVLCIIQLTTIF